MSQRVQDALIIIAAVCTVVILVYAGIAAITGGSDSWDETTWCEAHVDGINRAQLQVTARPFTEYQFNTVVDQCLENEAWHNPVPTIPGGGPIGDQG